MAFRQAAMAYGHACRVGSSAPEGSSYEGFACHTDSQMSGFSSRTRSGCVGRLFKVTCQGTTGRRKGFGCR